MKLIVMLLLFGPLLPAQVFHRGFGLERSFRLRQLAREAKRGDTTAAYRLAMEYALRDDDDTRNAFKALHYLQLADSLGSMQARNFLSTIRDDSTWMMDPDGRVLWHFKMRTLVLGGPHWDRGGEMLSFYYRDICRIAPFVDTLIIYNPNGYLEDEMPPERLLHTDYSIFTHVKVMVWIGDDMDYISRVPEKVLNLPSLQKLYLCRVEIDSAVTEKFYAENPKLKIIDVGNEYWNHPPELTRLLRYGYRRPEND